MKKLLITATILILGSCGFDPNESTLTYNVNSTSSTHTNSFFWKDESNTNIGGSYGKRYFHEIVRYYEGNGKGVDGRVFWGSFNTNSTLEYNNGHEVYTVYNLYYQTNVLVSHTNYRDDFYTNILLN